MLFSWDDPIPGFVRILQSLWISTVRKLGGIVAFGQGRR
jgi:hypothetical protein